MYAGGMRSGVRVLALLLLVLVLAAGGLIWFDFLGLVEADAILAPVRRVVGLQAIAPVAEPDDPLLLDRERLAKDREAVAQIRADLDKRERELKTMDDRSKELREQLAEKEKALQEREKSFNERLQAFENRRVNLVQNARYLVNMPPEKAVAMMMAMTNDTDVIDILRTAEENASASGEQSIVAYWLSLMPPERSSAIVRKMGRPGVR
jgi:flagellar protein FlbB